MHRMIFPANLDIPAEHEGFANLLRHYVVFCTDLKLYCQTNPYFSDMSPPGVSGDSVS
jgi:hypothetical protein